MLGLFGIVVGFLRTLILLMLFSEKNLNLKKESRMTKNDLKLIGSCIDSSNPKVELNYALVADGGIYATDTRKAIHFNVPMLECEDLLVHKKVLHGFSTLIGKDDQATIDGYGFLRTGLVKMSCDTFDYDEPKFPNLPKILSEKLEYGFEIKDISDLHFELTQRECYVDEHLLNPFIELTDCSKYVVSFNKQKVDGDCTNTGRVKIIGLYNTEEETELVKFTAMIMGREFKTQVKEQLLLDI
jgi:hypothetical protein